MKKIAGRSGLILLGINMPEMDGLTICQKIRELDIVELLSLNVGQVFDRERIHETVWGIDGDGNSDIPLNSIKV